MVEADRLLLRQCIPSDLAQYARLWQQPEEDGIPQPAPLTTEEVWARLLRLIGHWASFGYGLFVVEEKATGEIIGEVGFADFRRGLGDGFDGYPEAAWRMDHSRRGLGYASEAMAAATKWLERKVKPCRTVCMIHPGNAPSLPLARRLNYAEFDRRPYKGYGAMILLERQGVFPY